MPDKLLGESMVVKSDGSKQLMDNLQVSVAEIYDFVECNRKAYFEEHSLAWALDEIITRGKAEIKRAIKNGEKREKNAAAGKALDMLNLTPAQMVREFVRLKQLEAEAAKAKAEADAASAAPPPDAPPAKPKGK